MERPIRVLLIEDSPMVVELTRAMLDEAKGGEFLLECVDNLRAGIDRLSRRGVDVVLLDLTLPDSNGLDTFRRLHAEAEDIPIVVYTSVDDEALSLAALDHGAADYLVKSEVNGNWLSRSLVYAIQRSMSRAREPAQQNAAALERSVRIERSAESDTTWIATLCEKRLVSLMTLERIKVRLLDLVRRSDCQEVRIDLSGVEYVANAAISTLLIIQKRSQNQGKRLVLCEVSRQVSDQFRSRRFDRVFEMESASV